MSCTGDKVCNCQMDTPIQDPTALDGILNRWISLNLESGFENEKPGEKIKRKVNEFQEQVKIMLNNLVEELGINVEEIEVNKNEKGDKIEDVFVFWNIES